MQPHGIADDSSGQPTFPSCACAMQIHFWRAKYHLPNFIQKWQASKGHIHGSPIVWKGPNNRTWLYVMGEGDPLEAFPFESGKFNVQAVKKGDWIQPKLNQVPACQSQANHGVWMPGELLGVSSHGSAPGTGIVRAVVPANGDGNTVAE
jgi:hypothetical protein